MAALTKHTEKAVYYHLCHNTREYGAGKAPRNLEIDPERRSWNYTLHPESRGKSASSYKKAWEYYKYRMKHVYKMDRKDTICTAEWCVTAPKDLPERERGAFFQCTYEFLNSLYGEKNCIQCIVHFDEGIKNKDGKVIQGSPHLHYTFLATKEIDIRKEYDKKLKEIQEKYREDPRGFEKARLRLDCSKKYKYPEKLDFKGVLNKQHLKRFHSEFQKWIQKAGVHGTVSNGVTGGNNRSVADLKLDTKEKLLEKERIQNRELRDENKALKKRIRNLEKKMNREKNKDISRKSEKIIGLGEEIEL